MKFRRELVLIYQMGKVGSSAFEKAVPGALHIHTIHGGGCWLLRRFDRRKLIVRAVTFLRIIKLRLEIKFAKKVDVVTLVRDPHARNMSWFFQRLYVDLNYYYQDNNVDPRVAGFDVLFSAFEYNVARLNHYLFDDWFKNEFKRGTGIDIFSKPYDAGAGFVTYSRGNIRVFLTRFEDVAKCHGDLEDFLGVKFQMDKVNDASSKWYSELYKRFKSEYKPSKSYLDSIEKMQTFTHFYRQDK